MANNFEALIKARLDTSDVPKQIRNEIENNPNCEIHLKVNTTKLVSDIESALKKSFDISINPVINPNSVKTAGKQAAQAVKTAIQTGIGDDAVNINLSDVLELKGIDKKLAGDILQSFRKDINKTIVDLKQMDAQFTETKKGAQKLRSVKFVGIDEDGKTVSILTRIDQKTGEVSSTLTRVSQKFGETSKTASNTTKEFNKLISAATKWKKAEKDLIGLDTNSKEYAEAYRRAKTLEANYQKIFQPLSGKLSVDQRDQLSNIIRDNNQQAKILKGSLEDASNALRLDKFDSNKIDAEIASISRRLEDLKSTGHDKLIDVSDELAQLKDLREAMKNQTGDDFSNSYRNFSDILAKARNNLSIISDETKSVVTNLRAATLGNQMGTWLSKNSKAANDYGDAIKSLQDKLKTLNQTGKLTQEEFDNIEREFKEIQQAAISAGKTGKSFGDSLKKAFSGLAGIFTVDAILDRVVDGLREMYQAVYEIDTAMVNLRKVTDETEASYAKFLERSAGSAQELGRTVSSLVEQTANWTKLGYSMSEAEELAKLSSVYANVAEVSDDTAVSDMVTAMKANVCLCA